MLEALRGRVEAVGLELCDIEGIDPPKFALVRYDADHCFAILNDDGVPLFTFAETEKFIGELEEIGSFEDWWHGEEDSVDAADEAFLRERLQRLIDTASTDARATFTQTLREEVRVMVVQGLVRHKLIASSVPFAGDR